MQVAASQISRAQALVIFRWRFFSVPTSMRTELLSLIFSLFFSSRCSPFCSPTFVSRRFFAASSSSTLSSRHSSHLCLCTALLAFYFICTCLGVYLLEFNFLEVQDFFLGTGKIILFFRHRFLIFSCR